MIYRDDDLNVYTDVAIFKSLHNEFIKREQTHTVAVIMKDLWQNHAIFYYINIAPYLSVQLHGWEHKDYSTLSYDECFNDLKKSLDYWDTNSTRMMNRPAPKITTFFAPWNKEGENIKKACTDLNLEFCNVQNGTWKGENIYSFHWWATVNDNFKVFP